MHLLEKTRGRILYKGNDDCDVLDNYVGPYLIEVEPEDILMEDEVRRSLKRKVWGFEKDKVVFCRKSSFFGQDQDWVLEIP